MLRSGNIRKGSASREISCSEGIRQGGRTQGQVTIFFAIGVVLLIVILLAIYISSVAKDRPDANTAAITATAEYLGTCVDAAFPDALENLAAGGGAFGDVNLDGKNYMMLNFSVPTPGSTTGVNHRMALAIDASNAKNQSTQSPNGRNEEDFINASTMLIGSPYPYFGELVLPPLCARYGPNYHNPKLPSCPSWAVEKAQSGANIQNALARKIARVVNDCSRKVDKDKLGLPLSDAGAAHVEVLYGERTVTVVVTFPDGGRQFERFRVERTYPSRLLLFYNFIAEQLLRNLLDPRDSIGETSGPYLERYAKPEFKVQRVSDKESGIQINNRNYHLYRFSDLNHDGKHGVLIWWVLVQDRPMYTYKTTKNPPGQENVDPDG